ncbi:UDP-glucose 6-dehydrogenase [Acidiphilium multivorum AIU301]|uniref:UDP-glucose 6-dehydrogenase n=1 Tax=Acidiphilium multivorum (strain DSM 11245 / JCM 8867 / NBRC 100883 / AIU 301) TaxID=926570 RepID=F0IY82_ACIMA|nr:UDP-glucose 6-dehydrogenase RkpK [Acidiphilium sp. JA12-A1]MBU6357218.1 UDP-glucose/GDP-mannose dehydrogenase family protein [Rhodospirillales bacterium]UNC15388.1 UDP-glucose/GDP-mannose dehydrogenase family protein [Acidiphilium multivorum]BAJ80742.1 UDP-glucose 6-dehydrogenase [Acidiphilium multivorum AIU301]MDE2327265.1 UDP-glucose/GDP-mannose dehydrogenase family protein [Rhodospirillales bacterium]
MLKIAIIGGGYVGLVSAACFAEFGVSVMVAETDPARLDRLRRGEIPIYEPGLDPLVERNRAAGRLGFTGRIEEAIAGAEAVFIAVGTPSRRGGGHADLSYVFAAAEQVLAALDHPTVLVTKSTVPVGTGRRLAALAAARRPDLAIDVASNPEFLREGSAIGDFMRPDRVVVGAETERAREVLRALYRPLNLIETPILITGLETAELIKYAANAFLAMKVTFINEMADLCEAVGADVHGVARGMGLDRRIGAKFLHPGPGFGGSCFPKDTLALARIAQDARAPSRLTEAVVAVNDARKAGLGRRVLDAAGGSVRGMRVAVLGLAFKPETDDMRDSPAIPLIEALADDGADIIAYDPAAMAAAKPLLPAAVRYAETAEAAIEGAAVLVAVTEWNEFRALAPAWLAARMQGRLIVDLRNIFDPAAIRAAGFVYHGVGRGSVSQLAANPEFEQDFEQDREFSDG